MKIIICALFLAVAFTATGQKDTAFVNKQKREIAEEAKPVLIKATADMMELQEDIKLANQNLISKKEVVDHYNNNVGLIVGQAATFKQMEAKVKKAGDDYPKFLYLKEEARIAYLKAAAAKVEAESY